MLIAITMALSFSSISTAITVLIDTCFCIYLSGSVYESCNNTFKEIMENHL